MEVLMIRWVSRTVEQETSLALRLLGIGMAGLTPARGMAMAEPAAVCLENRRHSTGVSIAVAGISERSIAIRWDEVTAARRAPCLVVTGSKAPPQEDGRDSDERPGPLF